MKTNLRHVERAVLMGATAEQKNCAATNDA